MLHLHNQGLRIHSNEENVKEKEYINGDQDFVKLDKYLIITTKD